VSSYRLDRGLLVISTCKFCWGSGATSGRQGQWFPHHDNAPSHTSLVVQQFLPSLNHRTLRISLRVTSDCSLLRKWASSEHFWQPWRTSNRMRQPNSWKFQMNPSASASNNGRTYGASVCVWARVVLWRWSGTRCLCPTITVQYHHSGNFFNSYIHQRNKGLWTSTKSKINRKPYFVNMIYIYRFVTIVC
jgi:hypothetical protein